jgi:hypothetical protein
MSLLDAAARYQRAFLTLPDVASVPPEKEEEAIALLTQAVDLNQPFRTDADFRAALGLTGSR